MIYEEELEEELADIEIQEPVLEKRVKEVEKPVAEPETHEVEETSIDEQQNSAPEQVEKVRDNRN